MRAFYAQVQAHSPWRQSSQDGADVCHLPLLHSLFCITLFVLFVTWLIRDSTSVLIYDHCTLLNIRSSFEKYVTEDRGDLKFSETASHFNIPLISLHGCNASLAPPLLNKRRRCGKRGGKLVKLKAYLLSLPGLPRSQEAIRWGCGRVGVG